MRSFSLAKKDSSILKEVKILSSLVVIGVSNMCRKLHTKPSSQRGGIDLLTVSSNSSFACS